MKKKKVIWSERAKKSLREHYDHIKQDSVPVATGLAAVSGAAGSVAKGAGMVKSGADRVSQGRRAMAAVDRALG